MWTKWNQRISIRLRITLIVSLLLLAINLLFAGLSISSSRRHFAAEPIGESFVATYGTFSEDSVPLDTVPMDAISTDNISMNVDREMGMMTTAVAVVTEAQRDFSSEQIFALVLISLVGIALTYLVLGRALRPLTVLSEEIENIHEHNLGKSLQAASSDDEISSLTASFNSMLARLRRSFALQRSFAESAAHELKTPLAVLKSSLQLLEMEENPSREEVRESTAICAETVEQMIALVQDLLRFSAQEMEENEPIALRSLLQGVLRGQSEGIEEKGLHFVQECEDLHFESQPRLLSCILENLISNAVKYNATGGSIEVLAKREGEELYLRVRDTGMGIPPEIQEEIFEAFFRADPSRTKTIPGNGLGLSIAKAATEHLGGSIAVESILGEGSTFYCRLPIWAEESGT